MPSPRKAIAEGVGLATGAVVLTVLMRKKVGLLQATLAAPPTVVQQTNGSSLVSFQVVASGGQTPYTYSVLWSDGIRGASPSGLFQRVIPAGGTVPASALVTVKSADGQSVQIDD